MLTHTLLQRLPAWVTTEGPEGGEVILSQCTLSRNLADIPFPVRASEADAQAALDRITSALDALGMYNQGHFLSAQDLQRRELRFLAERRLITAEMLSSSLPRGVYINDDQTAGIMINGTDHLMMRALRPGLQLSETWACLSQWDDVLGSTLDYAYHPRRGFLTSCLTQVGTGLVAAVLVHLPALTFLKKMAEVAAALPRQYVGLFGLRTGAPATSDVVRGEKRTASEKSKTPTVQQQALLTDSIGATLSPPTESVGDLYLVTNLSTLGVSELEILFHVQHAVTQLVEQEQHAREQIQQESPRIVADLVGRALGVARGAHLLDFKEGLAVLSSLRLGLRMQLLHDIPITALNALLLQSQAAHLETKLERNLSVFEANAARADVFRARFAEARYVN
jgi:protein arginine kinase